MGQHRIVVSDRGWDEVVASITNPPEPSHGLLRLTASRPPWGTVVTRIKTHPGEVLREEFLVPLNMSARDLADAINVPSDHIVELLLGRRDVTADTAMRLAKAFDTTAEFWINLQSAHDLSKEDERK